MTEASNAKEKEANGRNFEIASTALRRGEHERIGLPRRLSKWGNLDKPVPVPLALGAAACSSLEI